MHYKIVILTDSTSWMKPYTALMADNWREKGHEVVLASEPTYGPVDIAFFLSFSRLVKPETLKLARSNVVVHGSDLPNGRGWSPWSWQIADGRNDLPLTLFEAADDVDSGRIYSQKWVVLEGHELIDEWQGAQALATAELCSDFVENFEQRLREGREQEGETTYFGRRTPKDSRLDANRSIAEQFNLLRIVDNVRYPAYFEIAGHRYALTISKIGDQEASPANPRRLR